jgi:peroxidase
LSQVYKHPHDVDLFIGGILEKIEQDAVVGPTFGEIIADQFSKFKKGDRYFYENGPDVNPGYFTPAQLDVIRRQTLARVICSNADRIALFEQSPHALWRPDYPG